jgi:hypothetical protein
MPKPMLVFSYNEIPKDIMKLIIKFMIQDDISCLHGGCIIYPDGGEYIEDTIPYYVPEYLPVAKWFLSQGVKMQCIIHFDY